jgi:hypothetical protein
MSDTTTECKLLKGHVYDRTGRTGYVRILLHGVIGAVHVPRFFSIYQSTFLAILTPS